jgi:ribonucleotide monophosphatase NagD (HAD superfamily)
MINLRLKYKRIACDFDGTIAYDAFPEVGGFKPHAERVLKKIKEYGGQIIIWTCRTSYQAELVKEMLQKAGVKYDAFNDNLKESLDIFPDNSRKVFADIYIDDRSIHCKEIDWLEIESLLFIDD